MAPGPERVDILIVGSGPAGAAATITAQRLGLTTITIDKARFPRDKCCGDALTVSSLRCLEQFGLEPAAVPSWTVVSDVNVSDPTGRVHRFRLPDDRGSFASIARRRDLDAALVARANALGADIRTGIPLQSVSVGSNGRVAAVAGGLRIDARYVVAADGMWSPTRRLLGLTPPGYRGEWHAFRQYFRDVTGQAKTSIRVWFEQDLLPGYVWSFPLAGGSANVGFGIRRGSRHGVGDMRGIWADIISRPHIRATLGTSAVPEGPHRTWPIPARLGEVPLTWDPVLFAGDAAAATDPLTGEGIGQALEMGRLAVECIAVSPEDPAAAGARYEGTLRGAMVRDHGLSRSISRLLSSGPAARWALAAAGSTGWSRRHFARWLFDEGRAHDPRSLAARPVHPTGGVLAVKAGRCHSPRTPPTRIRFRSMSRSANSRSP